MFRIISAPKRARGYATQNAVAFADNDVITVAWSYGKKPEGCMGFAVYRIGPDGKEEALPSHAVFKGDTVKPGQKTSEFPVQKFYWKDPYARLIAEKTGNRKFRYKVVPLEGNPHQLKPMTTLPQVTSNEVTISPALDDGISAFFNRGLISTQRVSRALKGKPSKQKLLEQIKLETNALRASLSGDMVEALCDFVARAKKSGTIYAALYELGDEQLIGELQKLGKRLHIVLSNSVAKEDTDEINPKTGKPKQKTVDANQPARAALMKTAGKAGMYDRIMPGNHIGHNKFLVYVDAQGKAQAVLMGSTNWTSTGLCAQTNNTLVIENPKIAKRYLEYWKKLAADTKAAKGVPKSLQGKTLRTYGGTCGTFNGSNGQLLESWFSPNTSAARKKVKAGTVEKCPADMASVCKHIADAEHAVLFLAFNPGAPSVANWCADALRQKKGLFVRGCVTNKDTAGNFYYTLKGTTPPKKVRGQKAKPAPQDPRVIGAEALDGKVIPSGWQKEILKAGFAIIHDKILVIDPFSDDKCIVATGSHNLGYKASYDNDENMVIVKGNKKLAVAYATHVLDVYDHFSWRWQVKHRGSEKAADQSLSGTPDGWMEKYFDEDGKPKTAQLKFWMSAVN
jgi:phosphatidylserine/phosphatidylglycerophosphate/cardiolipin synthase-like enzyme